MPLVCPAPDLKIRQSNVFVGPPQKAKSVTPRWNQVDDSNFSMGASTFQ
jgi:hypothetical protein